MIFNIFCIGQELQPDLRRGAETLPSLLYLYGDVVEDDWLRFVDLLDQCKVRESLRLHLLVVTNTLTRLTVLSHFISNFLVNVSLKIQPGADSCLKLSMQKHLK